MATLPASYAVEKSFLLRLLYFAGWRLQVRQSETARIRATRAGGAIEVTAPTLAQAAGTLFARAMRSGRTQRNG